MSDDKKIIDFATKRAGAISGINEKRMKGGPQSQQPQNPQFTLEVKNPEIVNACDAYIAQHTPENLETVINSLLGSRVLTPGMMNEQQQVLPVALTNKQGDTFQPIFTEKDQIPEMLHENPILNLPFEMILLTIMQEESKVRTMVINHNSKPVVLNHIILPLIRDHIQKMMSGELAKGTPFELPGEMKGEVMVMREGKMVSIDSKQMDPQQTKDVKNPVLEEKLAAFGADMNETTLSELVNELVKSRVLLPAKLDEQKRPIPLTIKGSDDVVVQPVFSSKEQIPSDRQSEAIMNLPFPAVVDMVLNRGKNIEAIVINPFGGSGASLKKPLLEQIMVGELRRTQAENTFKAMASIPGVKVEEIVDENGNKSQKLHMSPTQVAVFERGRFEMGLMPTRLFNFGQEFVDLLCKEREEFLDRFFEESYQDTRMYPYLPEEFKVLPMHISDTREVIEIAMPERDIMSGTAHLIFIVWNAVEQKGRYFAIVQGDGRNERLMIEIPQGGKQPILHGEAPEEGTELNWVIEKLDETEKDN